MVSNMEHIQLLSVAAIIIETVPPPAPGHLFPDNYGFNHTSGLEVQVELEFLFQ